MRTRIDRWGNSLGVRLPKGVADRIGLREGDQVDLDIEGAAVMIRRVRPRYSLDELLQAMTPESVHEDYVREMEPVGRERFWEDE